MAMFITQDTFDEVVKENMEDFGMDRQSATEDAIGQFKAQGADLSRIDTSTNDIRKDARAAINDHVEKLRRLSSSGSDDGDDAGEDREHHLKSECVEALSSLAGLCREPGDAGEANRMAVGEAGGVGVVASFLKIEEEGSSTPRGASVVKAALSAVHDVCRNTEPNRDAFIYTNMDQLTSLLLRWTDSVEADGAPCSPKVGDEDVRNDAAGDSTTLNDADRVTLVVAGLKVVKVVCTKAENNKVFFMRRQGARVLTASLRRYGAGESRNAVVTKEACGALRSVTLRDDRRQDFSGVYDNVKSLVSAGVIPLLLDAARAFEQESTTLALVYLALKQLAVNNESVKLIVENGGLELVSEALERFPLEVVVCRTGLSLFRNISANDVLKTKLVQEGGLRLVLGCMSQHKDDKTLQENGCATMAAMALRSPPNAAVIVQEGGIGAMLEAMRRHSSAQGLQRQACLCIRNIAARSPALRSGMLDEGCEAALREAGKLRGCVDEAYGALRDLQCEVGLVTMGETGKVQVGVKAFGEEKPNFDTSVQETKALGERITGAATAPAHSGHRL